MDSCTTIRMYGNQSPARSASATAEPSCATRWSARTPLTVPTPSSQTESAALSAQRVLHLHLPHQSLWLISLVAPSSASGHISDHRWLTGHTWTSGPKPACSQEDLNFRTESLWIYLWFIFNKHSLNDGLHLLFGEHACLCSDSCREQQGLSTAHLPTIRTQSCHCDNRRVWYNDQPEPACVCWDWNASRYSVNVQSYECVS